MSIYWVSLADGRQGCVKISVQDVTVDGAETLSERDYVGAKLGSEVVKMQTLPYAATPLLLGLDMTFCYTPTECAGRTSCPKRRSCCD